jgi:hypothetical protein
MSESPTPIGLDIAFVLPMLAALVVPPTFSLWFIARRINQDPLITGKSNKLLSLWSCGVLIYVLGFIVVILTMLPEIDPARGLKGPIMLNAENISPGFPLIFLGIFILYLVWFHVQSTLPLGFMLNTHDDGKPFVNPLFPRLRFAKSDRMDFGYLSFSAMMVVLGIVALFLGYITQRWALVACYELASIMVMLVFVIVKYSNLKRALRKG